MYISKIHIKGYRSFKDNDVLFNDGVNVIIGHNNAGKTNLIKALGLLLDSNSSKRLEVDDFNKNVSIADLKALPPEVIITLTISQSEGEDVSKSDDLVTVSEWLTKIDEPYEAQLTYHFFLPEKEINSYKTELNKIPDGDEMNAKIKAWKIIKYDFIKKYVHKIYGGNPKHQTSAGENLKKFGFQFLSAIRDVERDMFTGRNTLLRDVLEFFLDYQIDESTKQAHKTQFATDADHLVSQLNTRMTDGKKAILKYAEQTGASFNNAKPDFEGSISDIELLSALRLIVKYETGINISIPATHNGLGYNNLIFMSLLLAKMQSDTESSYHGDNAQVFPILLIEEPEAHLHPSMQFKFLKFLKENHDKKVRQIFITTHSTHITSAVSLDETICIHNDNGEIKIGYPGKVFPDTPDGQKSKKYVQRFLDATKSNMLFAQKIVFVEGLAEQLLIPTLAKYANKSLEDEHIAVITVDGRSFDHFLHLFDSTNPYTIHKKVVCLKDLDPEKGGKKCYPFEYGQDAAANYQNSQPKISSYLTHPNIRFYTQCDKGKTFEYELALFNPTCELLITETMKNKVELKELMELYKDSTKTVNHIKDRLGNAGTQNPIIKAGIEANTIWTDDDKKKAIIAARYLNSVGKGENALELANALEENLEKAAADRIDFNVPEYIQNSLEWITQ